MLTEPATRFDFKLLERHARSTQMFIPMNGVARYLVIVALGVSLFVIEFFGRDTREPARLFAEKVAPAF